jgi:hypothetical protein
MSNHIKRFIIFGSLLLTLGLLPALAQDDASHTVAFDGVGFTMDSSFGDNVEIESYAGDPVADAVPAFSDAPYFQFLMYADPSAPRSMFDSGAVRVYRTSDLAQYSFLQTVVDELNSLIANQSDLSAYMVPESKLPFLPIATHGQIIRARAHYVETENVSGVAYIAINQAAAEPFLSNTPIYTFQGISADGDYYVSAVFPVITDVFPAETPSDFNMETFAANAPAYYAESIAMLNDAAPESFAPSLTTIDALVQSLVFNK